ncbi:hypothetical protein [Paenibacillus massiliensis]|uniref:hypothetical protein n=1 Tax=Paenibacillus massiliensis TaxID=225917 RepID=UPI0004144832|nr:hypothetical protein [Paenibacillus massiliensis]
MAIITFWSPDRGRGNSANAAAVGTLLGLEYDLRTLMVQTQQRGGDLQGAFAKSKELQLKNFVNTATLGLDALERLLKTKRLTPESISNHSISLEPGRLDLLLGTNKQSRAYQDHCYREELSRMLPLLFEQANRYYQAIILDVCSGFENPVTNRLLEQSDLIVISLGQETDGIERCMHPQFWRESLQHKPKLILLSQYDSRSKYSMVNLKRTYRIQGPILTVPYLSAYRDAINDKDVLSWFRRTRHVGRRHDSYSFISDVQRITEEILTQVGVNTNVKRIERGIS